MGGAAGSPQGQARGAGETPDARLDTGVTEGCPTHPLSKNMNILLEAHATGFDLWAELIVAFLVVCFLISDP